ncbi:MAG: AhpC/TSA family protein [Bacteroidales bacterium]|nr:AhpC/TSA family protein [Bacteroidales bacterium]
MKKLSFLLLAVAAVGAFACSGDQVDYDITGINVPKDGVLVRLVDQISQEAIDSAVVGKNAFQMTGSAPKDAYLVVSIDGFDWEFPLFNDGKLVQLNLADSSMIASDLNVRLTECDKRNAAEYDRYNRFLQDFMALSDEEQEARSAEWIPQYRARMEEYTDFYMGMIEENKDNLIPVVFISQVPAMAGEEKFNELLASGAPFARHPYVLDLKRRMDESAAKRQEAEEKKQAVIGQKFLDLEEADPDGNMHKLSEFVGQGKWVLVDFWASWCGPCKREMPNVVNAYKKYHDKGFEIVGLSFDREKEPWVKAITEWEMPWIHLSDLKYWQSVASDVYSVNSIPDNLLIDPEGTVVSRGLRGDDLEAKLAEVMQ